MKSVCLGRCEKHIETIGIPTLTVIILSLSLGVGCLAIQRGASEEEMKNAMSTIIIERPYEVLFVPEKHNGVNDEASAFPPEGVTTPHPFYRHVTWDEAFERLRIHLQQLDPAYHGLTFNLKGSITKDEQLSQHPFDMLSQKPRNVTFLQLLTRLNMEFGIAYRVIGKTVYLSIETKATASDRYGAFAVKPL